jgi:hypothetical protein
VAAHLFLEHLHLPYFREFELPGRAYPFSRQTIGGVASPKVTTFR